MQEITLEELYQVITDNVAFVSKLDIAEVLTDLNKLGYKIVKE